MDKRKVDERNDPGKHDATEPTHSTGATPFNPTGGPITSEPRNARNEPGRHATPEQNQGRTDDQNAPGREATIPIHPTGAPPSDPRAENRGFQDPRVNPQSSDPRAQPLSPDDPHVAGHGLSPMQPANSQSLDPRDKPNPPDPRVNTQSPDPRIGRPATAPPTEPAAHAHADADGFTTIDNDHILGPLGCRDRVVRGNYEHVGDGVDGRWVYRRM